MGAQTTRTRDGTGAITTLNLASAVAADRRFDIDPATTGERSLRLFGFSWVKSAAEAVTITVSRIDKQNANKEVRIEVVADPGELDGIWRAQREEVAGYDPKTGVDLGTLFRIQFSQTGGACVADVTADYKGV